ncbi:hypothetical protein B005_1244 [Nocardiopsis alba ATCC BAA-2165]|uniref:Uncharacterized protein n=1 Tax=Nocardiopsis alba (strain ATCC BAA-2165 / BE74) TaxID=1205910 RepID=J7L3L9_NOCAA|nr:hypothetical protein B005_1244 [Nocardiopsis alba ATCC BAA-2165]
MARPTPPRLVSTEPSPGSPGERTTGEEHTMPVLVSTPHQSPSFATGES